MTIQLQRAISTRRWQSYSVFALGLLLLLGGALALTAVGRAAPAAKPGQPPAPAKNRPADVTLNGWTRLYYSSVVASDLAAAAAVSDTEMWAGGQDNMLLHYQNGTWITSTLPAPAPTEGRVSALAAISSTAVWAVDAGVAYSYDGTTWTAHPQAGVTVTQVSATAADNVWALGSTAPGQADVLRWDGTAWVAGGLTTTQTLTSLTMINSTAGWVARNSGGGGSDSTAVYHYDGTNWNYVAGPDDGITAYYQLSAYGPNDFWALTLDAYSGMRQVCYFGNTAQCTTMSALQADSEILMRNATDGWITIGSAIEHWNGAGWTTEARLNPAALAASATQIWAVGGGGRVWQRAADGTWPLVHVVSMSGGPPLANWNGVAGVSATDAWAVGSGGAIIRWDGVAWHSFTSPVTTTLYAVVMRTASDGWAGGGNTLLHWNGTTWSSVAPCPVGFDTLDVTGPDDVWVMGSGEFGGPVAHWHQNTWTVVPAGGYGYFMSYFDMDSSTHGWASGQVCDINIECGPATYEYSGGQWVTHSSPGFASLILFADGTGWGFDRGNLRRLQDGTWSTAGTVPTTPDRLAAATSAEIWGIAPAAADAAHYQDGTWSAVALPVHGSLLGISVMGNREAWAVGAEGTILHYAPPSPGQLFSDVPPDSPFYAGVQDLAVRGVIGGYADGTFRPGNAVTRGQLSKIVSLAFAQPSVTPAGGGYTFADVPPDNTFFAYVETSAAAGVIGGYACGGVNPQTGAAEGCDGAHRPYYRPGNNITRGQLSKIVVGTAGWPLLNPATATFSDVPVGSTFYSQVETAVCHGLLGGYADGTFRPANSASRGQTAKIVDNAILGTTPCNAARPNR